jgi:hypothetical protein
MRYNDCALLMRSDLNDCDRMGIQYHLATSIVHECTHAFNDYISLSTRRGPSGVTGYSETMEPYFEQEAMAELGCAMEKHVLGGMIESMNPYGGGNTDLLPLAFAFDTEWPSLYKFSCYNQPGEFDVVILKTDPLCQGRVLHPIPAQLFEDVQQ